MEGVTIGQNFKGNPLRMIQAKFGLNWPSGFRGEDFWKSLQMDDGRQVKAIAHTGELKINSNKTMYVIEQIKLKSLNQSSGPKPVKLCLDQ
jgi:hypothetical protein